MVTPLPRAITIHDNREPLRHPLARSAAARQQPHAGRTGGIPRLGKADRVNSANGRPARRLVIEERVDL
jgi:hypothetical protein